MAGYGRRKGNGVGQGEGWGGPAKGAGSKAAKANQLMGGGNAHVVASRASGISKRAMREQRSEALEEILYDLAHKAEREETKVSAAVKLHAIYNGTPIARNINVNADDVSALSDDELVAELARTGGADASDQAGTEASGVSPQLPGLLH